MSQVILLNARARVRGTFMIAQRASSALSWRSHFLFFLFFFSFPERYICVNRFQISGEYRGLPSIRKLQAGYCRNILAILEQAGKRRAGRTHWRENITQTRHTCIRVARQACTQARTRALSPFTIDNSMSTCKVAINLERRAVRYGVWNSASASWLAVRGP